VGRVLAALATHGLAENTIVVFTSDNGGERFSDTWPFTGRKTELLEGGLRVPTLISWPARMPTGVTSAPVAVPLGFMPTLLARGGRRGARPRLSARRHGPHARAHRRRAGRAHAVLAL